MEQTEDAGQLTDDEELVLRLHSRGFNKSWIDVDKVDPASKETQFVLRTLCCKKSGKEETVDPVSIRRCLARGWLRRKGARLMLTEDAVSFVRRLEGGRDGYRAQHQSRRDGQVEVAAGVYRTVTVNEAESPLAWLRKRKDKSGVALISLPQFEAGERLAKDFLLGQFNSRTTASWSALVSSRRERRGAPGAEGDLNLTALAARTRVREAIEAVGPELSTVLVDVCCYGKGLAEAEKNAGWPQRSGKVVLQIALTSLARHYGLISRDGSSENVQERIEHWGAEGYRPQIGE